MKKGFRDVVQLFANHRKRNWGCTLTQHIWHFIRGHAHVRHSINNERANTISTTRFVREQFMPLLCESRAYEVDNLELLAQLRHLDIDIEKLAHDVIDVIACGATTKTADFDFIDPDYLIPHGFASEIDVFTPFKTGLGLFLCDPAPALEERIYAM